MQQPAASQEVALALSSTFRRPIAHRGLHDAAHGCLENSRSAFLAAIAAGVGIECDVQSARDGTPMVFHDATLERMTGRAGAIGDMTTDALARMRLVGPGGAQGDAIEPLADLLECVAGRVPVLVEIKAHWSRKTPDGYIDRIADVIGAAVGPIAVKSFHPDVVDALAARLPAAHVGIVSMDFATLASNDTHAGHPPTALRSALTALTATACKPGFVSFRVHDLPSAGVRSLSHDAATPLFAWTVRSDDDLTHALRNNAIPVFEGLAPEVVGARMADFGITQDSEAED
ncbi:MAG: glycerophosphodiester phosphodiesterase family protein [Pseudomonadota bacterium]